MQEILAQFFVSDLVGRLVVMLGKLAHGAHVQLLSALGHAGKLHVFDHAVAQLAGGTEFAFGRHGMPPLGDDGS